MQRVNDECPGEANESAQGLIDRDRPEIAMDQGKWKVQEDLQVDRTIWCKLKTGGHQQMPDGVADGVDGGWKPDRGDNGQRISLGIGRPGRRHGISPDPVAWRAGVRERVRLQRQRRDQGSGEGEGRSHHVDHDRSGACVWAEKRVFLQNRFHEYERAPLCGGL